MSVLYVYGDMTSQRYFNWIVPSKENVVPCEALGLFDFPEL